MPAVLVRTIVHTHEGSTCTIQCAQTVLALAAALPAAATSGPVGPLPPGQVTTVATPQARSSPSPSRKGAERPLLEAGPADRHEGAEAGLGGKRGRQRRRRLQGGRPWGDEGRLRAHPGRRRRLRIHHVQGQRGGGGERGGGGGGGDRVEVRVACGERMGGGGEDGGEGGREEWERGGGEGGRGGRGKAGYLTAERGRGRRGRGRRGGGEGGGGEGEGGGRGGGEEEEGPPHEAPGRTRPAS